jgi:non-lysosomal glucosylceramidase
MCRSASPAVSCALLGLSCCLARPSAGADLTFDFETGDLQGWTVIEGAFDKLVCDRAKFHNQPEVDYNKQGRYFLSTLEQSDGRPNDTFTGVILSPVFVLEGPAISFLVGGGSHSDTYVALCPEDGDEVLRATGRNTEVMQRVEWRVERLVGRKAFMKIVDRNRGSWGHVTFDDFRASGTIDPAATAELKATYASRERALAAKREARRATRRVELMSEERLFARGEPRIYRGESLGAISLPIGGIGAGTIEISGEAVRSVWHIFNNFELSAIPDSFFAVRVRESGREPIVRALQTRPVGPFAAMASLTFRGEYPFGSFSFDDPDLPVRVRLETFSPLVPLNLKDSAIPCAVHNLTAENPGRKPVEVAFLATQQNAVGFTGKEPIEGRSCSAYGGNANRVLRAKGLTILHMSSALPESAPGYGDMALGAFADDATATAQWENLHALASAFGADGRLSGPKAAEPSPAGQTVNGALSVAFELKPGERRTVPFVLTWYFPNARHGEGNWGGEGNMYTNWWPDALGVMRDLSGRLDELTRLTRLYHDSLYASDLPHWLLDRISSQVVVLRSNTTFWCKDGYFGGWEGCHAGAGCCQGNCAHVWHYAQAHARLFPALGRLMREEEFAHQTPEGLVPFRQSWNAVALDGQCGNVLGAYREHLLSADRAWLNHYWPNVKRAMDYAIATWDPDEDGVLAGPQHNTLDGEAGGSSSWLGTMYLAALAAAEKMAHIENEADAAARYRRIRESGSREQNATLWNGEYYIQLPDATPREDYDTGCHIDQVLGQWWAHQLDLGWLYPPDRVRTALESLMKYNFRPDFRGIEQLPRKFVDDDDAGLQMITWPRGGRPEPPHVMQYASEVMSGFEYSAAAAMVQVGLLRDGFAVVQAAADRYDGRLRTGLSDAAWGYSGNPFCDDECGKFYARPMSIWSMLLACQGFIYDGPAGVIGFIPVWKPEDHRSFFTAAEGWGLFTQIRDGAKQTERIEVRCGKLSVQSLVFGWPNEDRSPRITVTVAGKRVGAKGALRDGRLEIGLPSRMTVSEGQAITVSLR